MRQRADTTRPHPGLPAVERLLLVVHRAAGMGHVDSEIGRLHATLLERPELGLGAELCVAADHREVSAAVRRFLDSGSGPAAVLAGGGGGTLRAVVEAVCSAYWPALPGPEILRLGALRMGSGNVLGCHLGMPGRAEAGLHAILDALGRGLVQPVSVLRCEAGRSDGGTHVRHGATLVGLGQFAHVPSDVQRWRGRWPLLVRAGARLLGIERLNALQYALSFAARALLCALRPASAGLVELVTPAGTRRMRLLAGAVLNGPVPQMPLAARVGFADEAIELCALGLPARKRPCLVRETLGREERLLVRLLERDASLFFLDEDPMPFHETLAVAVAGRLAFVPAPGDLS
jgi:diacylglycerol kinase family enzyme